MNNQHQTLLRAFKESENVLTLPEILRLGIAQYNTRIKELREKGYVIKNEILGTFKGVKHTQFKLISEPKEYVSIPSEKSQNFPSNAHRIAHENSLKNHKNEQQLTLI